MIVFLGMFFLGLFSALLETVGSKNISMLGNVKYKGKYSLDALLFMFVTLYMFLIAALRYETVGDDIKNYVQAFEEINTVQPDDDGAFERGYFYLNRLFHNVFGSFYLMQVVIVSFCCCVCYNHIKKHSLLPCFVLFMYIQRYFITIEMEQTRQWLAMSILILGWKFIKERSLIKWILIIALAMQFHTSSLVAFPLYFTTRIIIKPWLAFLLVIGSVWMTLYGLFMIRPITSFAVSLGILPTRFTHIINIYTNTNYGGHAAEQGQFNTGLGYMLNVAIYIFILILYKMSTKEDKEKCYILNFCIALILASMGRNFQVFSRLTNYYNIPGLGLSTFALLAKKNRFFKRLDWIQVIIVCFYLALLVWTSYENNIGPNSDDGAFRTFLPYRTFLTE